MNNKWIFMNSEYRRSIVPRKAAVKLLQLIGNAGVWISYERILIGSHWAVDDRLRHLDNYIENIRINKGRGKTEKSVDNE